MRLSSKHANPQTVDLADFSGGMNTFLPAEQIQPNELASCINMELAGNLLRTVSGTKAIYKNDEMHFTDMTYDKINDVLLLCAADKKVYSLSVDGTVIKELGTLTGTITPDFIYWEDGVLIASGGKLQYFNGTTLDTIDTSPEVCNGVFTSNGRVIVYYGDTIHYSGVGDETNWTEDTNDDSSSKWLQVGYKDGGKVAAVVNLASDIVAIKTNRHAYHIAGQFPDWQQIEISRNIDCKSWRAATATTNGVIVLGSNNLQGVGTTDAYGDMKATDLASKVQDEIKRLPINMKLRVVPALNQVWLISGERRFLFMDIEHQAFFQREYNTPALDVCCRGDMVYVLKDNAVCCLDSGDLMFDNDEDLHWSFYGKTLISQHDFLIKKTRVDIEPMFERYVDLKFYIGHVCLSDIITKDALAIWHDYTKIYHSKRPIKTNPALQLYSSSDIFFGNDAEIFGNPTYIRSEIYVSKLKRQIDRRKAVKVYGSGSVGRFTLNVINFEIVEV